MMELMNRVWRLIVLVVSAAIIAMAAYYVDDRLRASVTGWVAIAPNTSAAIEERQDSKVLARLLLWSLALSTWTLAASALFRKRGHVARIG